MPTSLKPLTLSQALIAEPQVMTSGNESVRLFTQSHAMMDEPPVDDVGQRIIAAIVQT